MDSRVKLIASLLLGCMTCTPIFGITTIQAWIYYQKFPKDSLITRSSVAFLWTLQGFQLGCSANSVYWYFVKQFADPRRSLLHSRWQSRMPLLCSVYASLTFQSYMARRIYHLSSSWKVTLVPIGLICFAFASGLVLAITKLRLAVNSWQRTPAWKLTVWASANGVTNIVLTAFMCVLLLRRRTGAPRTDRAIGSMALYIINTGVLTSIASILAIVFDLCRKQAAVMFMINTQGHMYTLALLTILHSRTKLQESWKIDAGIPLDTWGITSGPPVVISVETETRRASFHNGEAERAVFARMEKSRYPVIESRTYRRSFSKSRASTNSSDPDRIRQVTMDDLFTPS
ncbi:hypothetical protein BS47DRAFT_1351744 [Hydnum rufescens UP504]|uniref:DUF6534 domain-containing protein n=1 Tax=Hydnum rufescens UP504 TaxID=1448309 RepID=A0A9P6DMW5_9AGAM|nr:hypothetical protein BS47DRAFT_1351744 [Hydnum rufescens UP504]